MNVFNQCKLIAALRSTLQFVAHETTSPTHCKQNMQQPVLASSTFNSILQHTLHSTAAHMVACRHQAKLT